MMESIVNQYCINVESICFTLRIKISIFCLVLHENHTESLKLFKKVLKFFFSMQPKHTMVLLIDEIINKKGLNRLLRRKV